MTESANDRRSSARLASARSRSASLGLVVVGLGLFGAHGIAGQLREPEVPVGAAGHHGGLTGEPLPCGDGGEAASVQHRCRGEPCQDILTAVATSAKRSSWRTVRPATRAAIGATAAPFVAIPAARSCSCARRA